MQKVAIVGSGFGMYGLLPAFSAVPNCTVVALCAKDTERVRQACQRYAVPHHFTDWKEMFASLEIDAVAVAVTPSAQFEIVTAALQRSWHVFAEKPLAVSVEQAQALLDMATQAKVTHTIDFIFPQIEVWKKLKEHLQKKTLGEVRHVSLVWNYLSYDEKEQIASWKGDVTHGGGAVSYYFSHSLYALEYLFGEITTLRSQLRYSLIDGQRSEVGADMLFTFNNSIHGSAHFQADSRGLQCHRLVISCDTGTYVLENSTRITDDFVLTLHHETKSEIVAAPEELDAPDEDERVKIVKKLATAFVDASLAKRQLRPSFKDGLRVQHLIEQIRSPQNQ